MDINKLYQTLYEGSSPWLLLKKEEMTDDEFINLLGTKAPEINILLARTVEFLKNNHPSKSKRDMILEILEVLNRSYVARKFIGVGLHNNYKLFKGFPVRRGDEHDNLPSPGSEIKLKPKDTFISWTTDATHARESSAKYDNTKGEPIGGLLVELSLDSDKILFDFNAVINTVKQKYGLIKKYNNQAEPGMAISKNNTSYLAKEASKYNGDYEIISPTDYNSVIIIDNWEWNQVDGGKTVEWKTSNKKDIDNNEEKDEIKNEGIIFLESIYNYNTPLEEDFMDFVSKIAGTVRGNTLSYLEKLLQQFKTQQTIFELSKTYIQNVTPEDDERINIASQNIEDVKNKIKKINRLLDDIRNNKKLGLDFSNVE